MLCSEGGTVGTGRDHKGQIYQGEPFVNRNNWLLFFGSAFLVFVNFYTALTVLPLYVLELGGTEFDTGLQNTIFYLVAILLRFYFGPLTDSKGRKLPLLVGAFAFGTAPLLFLLSSNVWLLTAARAYHAIGLAAFFSSGGSLVADMAPPQRIGTYMGIYRLMFTLALLSGPSAAVATINSHGFTFWFWLSFFIGLVALLLVALVKPPVMYANKKMKLLQGLAAIIKQRAMWPIFLGISLSSIGYGPVITYAVLYISKVTSIANPGVYFTCFSLAGILANLSAGYLSDRFGRPMVIWPAIILLGLGVALLFYLPGEPAILIVSSIVVGAGFSGSIAALIAWLVDVTDVQIRGTVLAIQESTIDLSIGFGSFMFGVASVWLGMGVSFALCGLVVLLPALLLSARQLAGRVSSHV